MNIPFVVVHKNDWLNPSIPKIDPNLLICLPYPPKDSKSDLPLFSSICPFPKMVNNCKYGKYNHIQYIYIYILHIFIYGTIWDHISAYTHFAMISQQYAHLTKPPPGLRCSIPKANGRSASSSSKGRALRAGCPAVRSKPCRPWWWGMRALGMGTFMEILGGGGFFGLQAICDFGHVLVGISNFL
jgi:hypothetical protein